jgi:hypothetical protein
MFDQGGNMKRSAMMLGFVILSAACATSQSPKKVYAIHADDLGDKEHVQLDRENTVICEDVPVAGSHFPQRICMTNADRERMRHSVQNQMTSQSPSSQISR